MMKVATFNENSKIVGRDLQFEGNRFIVEGIGELGIDNLLGLDASAALTWEPGVQEKIYKHYGKELPSAAAEVSSVSGILGTSMNAGKASKSSRKPKYGKSPYKPLWITAGILVLILIGVGGYFIFRPGSKPVSVAPPKPSVSMVSTASVAPTPTVEPTETVNPVPLTYSYDMSQAVAAFNGYVSAMKAKKYSTAYAYVYFPATGGTASVNSTNSTVATPSVSQANWAAANLAAGYTISANSLTMAAIAKMTAQETSSGLDVTMNTVAKLVVKNSYQGKVAPQLTMHWDSALNTYKVEDDNAFLREVKINKSFTKKSVVGTSTVTVTVKVTSVLLNPASVFAIWNYSDSGTFGQISTALNVANTKATLFGSSVASKTIWQSKILLWSTPQTVDNNCVILIPKTFDSNNSGAISITLDMSRKTSVPVPIMKFNF
jgi:hypothetical protein